MNDPFVTYDTFTVGSELDGLATPAPAPSEKPRLPSILARLPKLPAAPPRPQVRQRFDDAEPAIPMAHLLDEEAVPTTREGASPKAAPFGDPTATIRFDTVSPTSYSDDGPQEPRKPAAQAAPATLPFAPPPAAAEAMDDPWSAWLLNLEATIQPYSRWIALAAVIAALGLTVVLLRGGGATLDTSETAPQVSTDGPDQVLAYETPDAEAPTWLTPQPVAGQASEDLQPADSMTAVAVGPVSAPRAAGQAVLNGEVYQPTPRVADASAAYPDTRTQR